MTSSEDKALDRVSKLIQLALRDRNLGISDTAVHGCSRWTLLRWMRQKPGHTGGDNKGPTIRALANFADRMGYDLVIHFARRKEPNGDKT